jgi:hypothetical protein
MRQDSSAGTPDAQKRAETAKLVAATNGSNHIANGSTSGKTNGNSKPLKGE